MSDEAEPAADALIVCLDATKRPHTAAVRTRCDDCGRAIWLSHLSQREMAKEGIVAIPICIRCASVRSAELGKVTWLEGQRSLVAQIAGTSEEKVQEIQDFMDLMLRNGIDPDPLL